MEGWAFSNISTNSRKRRLLTVLVKELVNVLAWSIEDCGLDARGLKLLRLPTRALALRFALLCHDAPSMIATLRILARWRSQSVGFAGGVRSLSQSCPLLQLLSLLR
jgi:hypothetical protein